MRAFALLVFSLLAFGGLAGCFGSDSDGATTDPAKTPTSGGTGAGGSTSGGSGAAPTVKVLAPLTSAVTIDAPAWVKSGTEVAVSLSAPANAKGALTYAWAVGPLPGTVAVTAVNADTGSTPSGYIQPGASKTLMYGTSGVYTMHCHPHPYMLHNVTVIDGYAGPKKVEVSIVDGASVGEYRFVPQNIVIGTNTTVTYKNVGAQPHTATTMGAQEPALTAAALKADTGTIKIEGNGWMRVLAIFQDSEGRLGIANKSIYVTPELPAFTTKTESMSFTYGTPGPLGGSPAQAAPKSVGVTLAHGGLVNISYSFSDAVGPTGQNLAEVEAHFKKDGETQDTLTGGPAADGVLEGKAIAGAYTLTVVPMQGIEISGTVVIDVVYDLIPPAPAMQEEDAGHGGHGGHAH